MTTLHTLRRAHGLTFSELSAITQIPVRRLAAFEYQSVDLDLADHQRLATLFNLGSYVLQGGISDEPVYLAKRHIPGTTLGLLTITATLAVSLYSSKANDTVTHSRAAHLAQTGGVAQHSHPTSLPRVAMVTGTPTAATQMQAAATTLTPSHRPATITSTPNASPRIAPTAFMTAVNASEPGLPSATSAPKPAIVMSDLDAHATVIALPSAESQSITTAMNDSLPPVAPARASAKPPSAPTPLPLETGETPTQPAQASAEPPSAPTDHVASNTSEIEAESISVTLPKLPASIIPIQLDPPAVSEPPTVTPPPSEADPYENNYDFDHASTIVVGAPIHGLNFVCPGAEPCADNDFFRVTLTGGMCYRVATSNLSAGVDTNVILYGPGANKHDILGGNDDRAASDPSSEINTCLPNTISTTHAYIVVGSRDNQPPPAPIAGHTYTLRIDATRPVTTPTARPQHPSGCPLAPTSGKVVVIQPWGVGTHAPAAQWGGVDLIVQQGTTSGTPVMATHDGRVQVLYNSWPGGNYVSIAGKDGWRTAYAHLDQIFVTDGSTVTAGTILGTAGQTGWASGPHLHYETWHHGINVDPEPMLLCD